MLAVAGGRWLVVVFGGWCEDSDCVSVVPWDLVVKDQVGRLLTGIGGDGGAEDRVGLRALRHHIVGVFNWPLRGLRGLRLRPGLPLFLCLLQFPHRSGEGTLQMRA